MASAMPTTTITDEERRWFVIGMCMTKVLSPALRNVLATEIPKWHQVLCQPPTDIDKQVYGRYEKRFNPSTINLNYKNINNNNVHSSPRLFDYAVKDPLSLAKLFVPSFLSKFTGFDETMGISAVLSVICEAAPFTAAAAYAKTVRSDIRNEWAHTNFANWTEAKFNSAFLCMETLLKNVNLSPEEEQQICDDLNNWKDKVVVLAQCSSAEASIDVVHRTTQLTSTEISRLSRFLTLDWDCLAGLLDIPYNIREEIRFSFQNLSLKAEQVLVHFNNSQCFDRLILKKCFHELGRESWNSAMLPMENEGEMEDAETGSLQAPFSENEDLVYTPLSSRELYRLSRGIVLHWEILSRLLLIPIEDRNIIRSTDRYHDDRSRAEKMLSIFNCRADFSREILAHSLEEIGQSKLIGPMSSGKWRRL